MPDKKNPREDRSRRFEYRDEDVKSIEIEKAPEPVPPKPECPPEKPEEKSE